MLPSAVSATRCCGCQPVRAVADFDTSRADRKAWRVNGLAPAPPAQPSQAVAAISSIEGTARMRKSWPATVSGQLAPTEASCGASFGPVLRNILGSKSLEDHLVGEARRHGAVVGVAHRP